MESGGGGGAAEAGAAGEEAPTSAARIEELEGENGELKARIEARYSHCLGNPHCS